MALWTNGPHRKYLTPRLGVLHQYPPRALALPPAKHRRSGAIDLPSISIVTPSFNQGKFIARTIDSVLDQNYPKLEYVVQDGGSTDNSISILERFNGRLTRWNSAPDAGQAQAINRAFTTPTGDLMAWINSDDLLLPGALDYVGEWMSRHPQVDVIYGHRVLIDADDREVGRWLLPPHRDETLMWADFVPQETMFWRRSLWTRVGGSLDESFQFALDWDLLLRFRSAGARIIRVPRFLGAFRVHSQQKTSAQIDDLGLREMDRLRQRCHGRAVSQEEVEERTRGYVREHLLYHYLYRLGVLRY